mgnify:CR=1 FL=1
MVDVPAVTEYAAALPGVVHADENLFTCSQDTQEKIKEKIKEEKLNRVVVASCSPKTHAPMFMETLEACGLNQYLFEMANIRNQNSWVHANNPEIATEKAKDLVRAAVARSAILTPLHGKVIPVNKKALVVGGGIAGMNAALEAHDLAVSMTAAKIFLTIVLTIWLLQHLYVGWRLLSLPMAKATAGQRGLLVVGARRGFLPELGDADHLDTGFRTNVEGIIEAGVELDGDQRAQDRPPRFGRTHHRDAGIAERVGEAPDGVRGGCGVLQQRGDVLENHPLLGKIRNLPYKVLKIHIKSTLGILR